MSTHPMLAGMLTCCCALRGISHRKPTLNCCERHGNIGCGHSATTASMSGCSTVSRYADDIQATASKVQSSLVAIIQSPTSYFSRNDTHQTAIKRIISHCHAEYAYKKRFLEVSNLLRISVRRWHGIKINLNNHLDRDQLGSEMDPQQDYIGALSKKFQSLVRR